MKEVEKALKELESELKAFLYNIVDVLSYRYTNKKEFTLVYYKYEEEWCKNIHFNSFIAFLSSRLSDLRSEHILYSAIPYFFNDEFENTEIGQQFRYYCELCKYEYDQYYSKLNLIDKK